MRWAMLILLLMIAPASAADRWPANVCAELANQEKIFSEKLSSSPPHRAAVRAMALGLLDRYCPPSADVQAKIKIDQEALKARSTGPGASRGSSSSTAARGST